MSENQRFPDAEGVEVKPKKTTKKKTKASLRNPKTKVVKEIKKVRIKKPNYLEEYEKGGYLENLQRALGLWSQLETLNMKEDLKAYVYSKIEECIYNKIVNDHIPWCERFELSFNEEETKED